MIQDVVGGNLDLAVGSVASIRSSGARVLATLGEARSAVFRDAPSTGELGYKVSKTSFIGLYAPRATPSAVVDALEGACQKATAVAAYQKLETDSGAFPMFLKRDAFASRLADDNIEKAALIKALNFKIE